jgi:hypothetical protein
MQHKILIKEARKLLGKEGASLNDDQVREIVITLYLMAKGYLRNSGSKNS